MKKSSFVFITMSVIYLAVAIFDGIGWMTVTNNVLLGLSLSALLSALSDILYNIGYIRTAANEFDYIIKTTVEFLSKMQAANIPSANPNINIKGVMQYVKGRLAHKYCLFFLSRFLFFCRSSRYPLRTPSQLL